MISALEKEGYQQRDVINAGIVMFYRADDAGGETLTKKRRKAMKKICSNCGSIGRPKKVIVGSPVIEIMLWLCFLIPGILYSAWRGSAGPRVCRRCGAPNMVPLNSPMGKQITRQTRTGGDVIIARAGKG